MRRTRAMRPRFPPAWRSALSALTTLCCRPCQPSRRLPSPSPRLLIRLQRLPGEARAGCFVETHNVAILVWQYAGSHAQSPSIHNHQNQNHQNQSVRISDYHTIRVGLLACTRSDSLLPCQVGCTPQFPFLLHAQMSDRHCSMALEETAECLQHMLSCSAQR